MASTPEGREPTSESPESSEAYEPPAVEEVSTDHGPAVTAAGDSPQDDAAISLVEEDE